MDCNGLCLETGVMRTSERTETPYTVVSRHNTSDGVVIWMRCTRCEQPRMVLRPYGTSGSALAAGHHLSRCPNCG